MKKAHRNRGFTLIELLVAVALMLILVGAVATIFKSTSDIMLRADATMSITQNGRAMIEIMSRDLASVQVGSAANELLIVRKPALFTSATSPYEPNAGFLEFNTITSWRDPTLGTGEGVARVRYGLAKIKNRWTMFRGISLNQGGSYVDSILTQYVVADGGVPRMRVEYYWDPTPSSFSSDARFFEPDATPASPPATTGSDARFDETNLPSAIRITVYLTGRRQEIVRPFSQVFWIATGVR